MFNCIVSLRPRVARQEGTGNRKSDTISVPSLPFHQVTYSRGSLSAMSFCIDNSKIYGSKLIISLLKHIDE